MLTMSDTLMSWVSDDLMWSAIPYSLGIMLEKPFEIIIHQKCHTYALYIIWDYNFIFIILKFKLNHPLSVNLGWEIFSINHEIAWFQIVWYFNNQRDAMATSPKIVFKARKLVASPEIFSLICRCYRMNFI
jgi:hypothetical protein